jgi:hypothetical protein
VYLKPFSLLSFVIKIVKLKIEKPSIESFSALLALLVRYKCNCIYREYVMPSQDQSDASKRSDNLKKALFLGCAIAGLLLQPAHARPDMGFENPPPGDRGPFVDVNPSENPNVMHNQALKTIYDSTVVAVLTDRDWNYLSAGTATFLANTNANGYPMAISIRHAVDMNLYNVPDGHLILINHAGKVLAVAMSIPQEYGAQNQDSDTPMLIAIDPRYPVNHQEMSGIFGVRISATLPAGPLSGQISSPVGMAGGTAGAGWYNRNGEMVGVVASFMPEENGAEAGINVRGFDPVVHAFVPGFESGHVNKVIYARSHTYVQTLAAGPALRSLGIQAQVTDYRQNDDEGFSFGYPGMISAYFTGNLRLDPQDAQRFVQSEYQSVQQNVPYVASVEAQSEQYPTLEQSKEREMVKKAVDNIGQGYGMFGG